VWLRVFGDAVFLAAFFQQNVARALGEYGIPMAAPLPKGALAGRTVPDVPALHRLLRRAFQLSKARLRCDGVRPARPSRHGCVIVPLL
jgi:putative restriction endonuclease